MLLLLVFAATTAHAALGGVPENPVPGRTFPKAWLFSLNDDWSPDDLPIEKRYDDHRTANFVSGLRMDRWLLFVDYSIMTDRWSVPCTRADEMTVSVGRLIATERELGLGLGDRLEIALGGGLRATGDMGGNEIQNNFHTMVATPELELPYDEGYTQAIAWGSAEWSITSPSEGDGWRVGGTTSLRGLISTKGEQKVSVAAHAVLYHRWVDMWLGLRYEMRGGDAPSPTKNHVNSMEEGAWMSFGIAPTRYVSYLGGYNLDTGENYGGIGLIIPMS
jgi:hypothetical protein